MINILLNHFRAAGLSTVKIILFLSIFLGLLILTMPLGGFNWVSLLCLITSYLIYHHYLENHRIENRLNCSEFILAFIFLFSLCSLSSAVYWIYDISYTLANTHAPFGSIETGRYSNIAEYILKNNSIPRIKQSYGQSILAAFFMIFSGANAPFSLFLIIGIAKSLLALLVYSFSRNLHGIFFSIFLSLALLFIGDSVFLFPVINYDNGTPIVLNGYFDAIYSFISLFIFIYINIIKNFKSYYINILLYISWLLTAPQNLLLIIIYQVISLLYNFSYKNIYHLLIIFIVLVFGYFFGGFFLGIIDPVPLEEIAGLDILLTKFRISFNFGLDFLMFLPFSYPGFSFEHISVAPIHLKDTVFYNIPIEYLSRLIVILLNNFLSLYVLFMVFINRKYFICDKIKPIYLASFILFILVCFLEVTGYKWQMSRFLMPFSILSIFIFLYAVSFNYKNKLILIINIFLIIYLSFFNFYSFIFRANLFLNNSPFLLLNKLILFF